MIAFYNRLSRLLIAAWVIIFSVNPLHAQQIPESAEAIEKRLESVAEAIDESADVSELGTLTTERLENPVNLNKAGTEEMLQSGLFTDMQVSALLRHRELFGPLLAIYELQVIEGFDTKVIRDLQPFITTGREIDDPNASLSRMINDGQHQVIVRMSLTPEEKDGFKDEEGGPVYQGNPVALYTRYRFRFMNKLSWGLTAEKDEGEQFFGGAQKTGFDFYSAHLSWQGSGTLRKVVAGDFQLAYGQGLTLSTGMSGGKSPDPVTIRKNSSGIRPYTSSNEVFFRRGVAVSLARKRWSVDLFGSRRKLDGNLKQPADSLQETESFSSFGESGYHRTTSEIADRRVVGEWMLGTHVRYTGSRIRIGATGVRTLYDKTFEKTFQRYNQFEFRGSTITNFGLDYSFVYRNFSFFGEAATSLNGAVALLHGVVVSMDPRLGVSVLFRNYPRNYHVLYSGATRESGNNYNEKGIYAGCNFRPGRTLGIVCSYDRFFFPWLRYQVFSPSHGHEFAGLISWTPTRKTELYLRLRETKKQESSPSEGFALDGLTAVNQRGARIHLNTTISKSITLRTRAEFVVFRDAAHRENGMMIFQDVQFHPMASAITFNFRYALFDTEGYDSRIYAYENDVLYGYSIPASYYKGSRVYFNTHIRLTGHIDMWVRYSGTFYTNRDEIGSGNETITGSVKSQVKVQLRFEF